MVDAPVELEERRAADHRGGARPRRLERRAARRRPRARRRRGDVVTLPRSTPRKRGLPETGRSSAAPARACSASGKDSGVAPGCCVVRWFTPLPSTRARRGGEPSRNRDRCGGGAPRQPRLRRSGPWCGRRSPRRSGTRSMSPSPSASQPEPPMRASASALARSVTSSSSGSASQRLLGRTQHVAVLEDEVAAAGGLRAAVVDEEPVERGPARVRRSPSSNTTSLLGAWPATRIAETHFARPRAAWRAGLWAGRCRSPSPPCRQSMASLGRHPTPGGALLG